MADADHALSFWTSVASMFKRDKLVLFHTFDEPHDVNWACVLRGCVANDAPGGTVRFGSYQTVGNQAIVNAIRAAGAQQPIIISGPEFAGDLTDWEHAMPVDPRHQLAADVSSFDYADDVLAHEGALRSFARRRPVIVGGFGNTNCTSTCSAKVMSFMDSVGQSFAAWTWDTAQDYGGCANALLDDAGPAGQRTAGRLLQRETQRVWSGIARTTARSTRGDTTRGRRRTSKRLRRRVSALSRLRGRGQHRPPA